jgi:hypothetical protein
MSVKTHTFRGRRYYISREKIDGYCEIPGEPADEIWINPGLNPKDTLETEIHEALHALMRTRSDRLVTPMGRDLARFLWRLGYRKT